jgi:hypothetical protein
MLAGLALLRLRVSRRGRPSLRMWRRWRGTRRCDGGGNTRRLLTRCHGGDALRLRVWSDGGDVLRF